MKDARQPIRLPLQQDCFGAAPKPARVRRLRWRPAKGAGKRRCDVGGGDDLLGRFFGRHFLAGGRGCAWRRIYQPAVFDDFFELRAVERFVLEQGFCDYLQLDRKSTRLNSSHSQISYAVFCLKKKNNNSKCEYLV